MFSFSQSVSFFPKIKHFFSPKQNEIFGTSSGRTQDVFPFFSRGRKSHRVESANHQRRFGKRNKVYHRKADHKLFHISKEDPILVARIEGEEFFSLEEIQTKLGLSPTRFLNQIKSGKFAKKIDWISDELFSERNQQVKKSDELEEIKSQLEEMKLQFEEKIKSQLEEMKSQFEEKMKSQLEEMKSQFEEKMKSQLEEMKSQLQKIDRLPSRASVSPEVFKSKTVFSLYSFNINSVARFIRGGIIGKIQPSGPKTHRYVLIDGRKEYLPDLVEQIIRDHIVPVMENETQEEKMKRFNEYIELKGKKIDGLTTGELTALRRRLHTLDPMVIVDISKELMKMI